MMIHQSFYMIFVVNTKTDVHKVTVYLTLCMPVPCSMLNGTVPSGGGIPPASPVFEDNMGGENAEDSHAEPEPEHKQPKLASLSMFVMVCELHTI